MLFNKSRWDGFPSDVKALFRYTVMAQSADMAWEFMDRNSKDLAEFKQKNVRVIKTPDSILQAQLNAWNTIIERETAKADTGPAFKKILDSQREWAARVGTLRSEIMVSNAPATAFFFRR
jgi:TRAP-type mannitol/chloroaromatic compound transport system substrate-binding protein